jgi:2-dehydropantoate 2-reductase
VASIAVIGAGAVGSVVAARLMQSPANAVTVATRSPVESLQITYRDSSTTVSPRVLLQTSEGSPQDWVLVTTKAYDAPGAAKWFATMVGPHTSVAILQNGVEQVQRFAPYIPPHQILPVVVELAAERIAPGAVRQNGPPQLTVGNSSTARGFAALFDGTGIAVVEVEDFVTAAWRKLCLNVTGAVSALALTSDIRGNDPDIAALLSGVVDEAIQVGNAAGARLDIAIVDEIVRRFQNGTPQGINSMLADRLAGRPMEIDARNGAVVRIGAEHGIPTPVNGTLLGLLRAVQPHSPTADAIPNAAPQ